MWLYIKTGFYSIVHKPPCGDNELMVRVRCKDDIDKLQKRLQSEYEFNGEVIDMVMDYDNFKNTVGHRDYRRRDAYMRCWDAMYEWQRDLTREKKAL